ncbi:MAG: DUF2851 family protein [Fluviicola sp.]|nr:DUF2851 family protein [Fluviicola sp.]
MKEEYLHHLWKNKQIPFHQLKLTTGEDILINDVGQHNKFESGPDFSNGKIKIGDVTWFGNIEFHIKSSDWYQHNHQFDKAYDNVILHVVYIHDQEVFINTKPIPTIELKGLIPEMEEVLNKHEFPCSTFLDELDSIYLESMKEKAIIKRLNRRISNINKFGDESNPQQILYSLLAQAFGCKINAQPFQELTNRIPIKFIKKEHHINVKTILLNVSGIGESELLDKTWIHLKSKYNLGAMSKHVWKHKGLRPKSFPEIRLLQFAEIVDKFDFETSFVYLDSKELVVYLKNLLELTNNTSKISRAMIDLIIINCFVPFIWWYGNVKMDESIQEKSLDLLQFLKAEENHILKKWKALGVSCINSFDSQALLEIYNEFCTAKKCLECEVGNKIIYK